ncbi:hypothetical protein [Oscillatoria sp. FACHB-1406]|uniref:hypothetical protein n=1 Tax=Oscillatoria sp. FACHB-1406 TaxID=2692846 RepID=UPI001687A88F|nr:hypothetical protein [Oscillatoria sp. FACHB-1406]MBD2579797.1 hypothetical protein [Oscillatoria sp. FACHB-1406]
MQCFDKTSEDWESWICPDLGAYWRLARYANSDRIVLKPASSQSSTQSAPTCFFVFDAIEGYALQYFNGQNTVRQVQTYLQQKFPHADSHTVTRLIERLIAEGILAARIERDEVEIPEVPTPTILKPGVEWHYNPDGYWILWNREERTYLQVSQEDKTLIEQLALRSKAEVLAEFDLSASDLQVLFQNLAMGRMLPNQQPIKRQRRKFTPFQLLYFKRPLFNPDPWLNRKIGLLRWIWTRGFALVLIAFLAASLAIGIDRRDAILVMGQNLMQSSGGSFFIPFALLSVFVVTLHELGHAFTLKHYGREVPEVGLLFMCLFPAAYTDTTAQYLLPKWKRVLVVGAGILVQVTIAAIALLFWNLAIPGSWLHSASYLLMVAALFTVAVNLNPMAKFDGYYLAVAATGINNLRNRAFQLYVNLFTGQPLLEEGKDRLILAIYAPFSLLYIWSVFGFLFYRLFDWTLVNIPALGAMLLFTWLLYYFAPDSE